MVKGTFRKRWTWSVWAAIGFTAAWTLAFDIMLLATCSPVKANWKVFDPYYEGQWTCADTRASSYAAGVLAVLSDCYSLVLPWAMTWPLEMPRRQKIALNMVFSIGIIVVIAACFRTKHAVDLGSDYDSTWYVPTSKVNVTILTDSTQGWILGLLLDATRVEPGDHLQLRALASSFFPRIPQRHSRQGAQQSLEPQQI
jgi:hypothetical protein